VEENILFAKLGELSFISPDQQKEGKKSEALSQTNEQ
jgi:hypothetical protein